MTSKEALKYLLADSEELYNQYEEDEKFYLDAVELYNIVLKDLEVLEILKRKNVDIQFIKEIMHDKIEFDYYPYDNLTNEEFNKIKEWIENGK